MFRLLTDSTSWISGCGFRSHRGACFHSGLLAMLFIMSLLCSVGGAIVVDGDISDWGSPGASVTDPADMADPSGDIREIGAVLENGNLYLMMSVEGIMAPAVGETSPGMTNRYYYHWILDTDNNPATGFNNSEYEGNPTNLNSPIGADLVIMIGWRDGAPNGVEAYDPLTEEVFVTDFTWAHSGSSAEAVIPLDALGLTEGSTVGFSAFQEGASDDWAVDWVESDELVLYSAPGRMAIDGYFADWGDPDYASVNDPQDMVDPNGDIKHVEAYVECGNLNLLMTVFGKACPEVGEVAEGDTNRYYYHWLLDTDNNPATGFNNSEYEGNPTNLNNPIGADLVIMIGWRDGAPNGVEAYDPLTEELFVADFQWAKDDDTLTATIPLEDLGLAPGTVVGFSSFQEGASDDWAVDWVESDQLDLTDPQPAGNTATVTDPQDMVDPNGDIKEIQGYVQCGNLNLMMSVYGKAGPTPEETAPGDTNRYYYHWLIDVDNNPATGFSNSEYEGNPTNVNRPIGVELVIMIGWRDGAPNGIEAYNPLTEEVLVADFQWAKDDDTFTAVLPLDALGIPTGQTVGLSAFQEGASDDWAVDWMESVDLEIPAGQDEQVHSVEDPMDMVDPNGDIKLIQVLSENDYLYLRMSVYGSICPTAEEMNPGDANRYYYHWLIDSDNNPATGFNNSEYEGNPTNLVNPIGADIVVMIGWRDGAPNGVEAYDPLTEELFVADFEWESNGDSMEARIPFADLGLTEGQTVGFSAFQEGASDDWAVDWVESVEVTLTNITGGGPQLKSTIYANGYSITAEIEDDGSNVVDEATVTISVDGTILTADVNKENGITTAMALNPSYLDPGSEHTVVLSYSLVGGGGVIQTRTFPFTVEPYTVMESGYAVPSVNMEERGFIANPTQISGQIIDWSTDFYMHGNDSELAEKQLAGEMVNPLTGEQLFNEASFNDQAWEINPEIVEGVINWHDFAPEETGHFFQSNGYEDQLIPQIPGLYGSSDGLVFEILTYLELSAGYHTLGVNTVGGFKASTGYSPKDKLGPVIAVFNGTRDYSYMGDHYFHIAVEEDGYYPFRLLWFHGEQTYEYAQLELYSVEENEKVLINDDLNPMSIKAYRSATQIRPYVSRVRPIPDAGNVEPDAVIELEINSAGTAIDVGSIAMQFNGADVEPVVNSVGDLIELTYDPGGMVLGSFNMVEISFDYGNAPTETRSDGWLFGIHTDAAFLPREWSTPVGTGVDRGFNVRTAQSSTARANTTSAAEAQLAGSPADLFTGQATSQVINYNRNDGAAAGLFPDDQGLVQAALMSSSSSDYLSMEVIAYVELTEGLHTLGVNSDDGFRVTAGRFANDNTLELGVFEGGRGDAQTLFDVVAEQTGLYAIRMIWYQGTGDASVELYSYDRETEQATLINDPAAPGAIKAYQARSEDPTDPEPPTISIGLEGPAAVVEWTGTLQKSDSPDGPWTNVADDSQSPMILVPEQPVQFMRSVK